MVAAKDSDAIGLEPAVEHVSHDVEKFRDFQQTADDGHMKRGLKSRHIQLIALGEDCDTCTEKPG